MAFDSTTTTESFGFQDNYQTTLADAMTDSQTTCELAELPTPDESTLVIEPGTDSEEEIYYTSKGEGLVNIPSVSAGRGVNGTAKAHNAGAVVKMMPTKAQMDTLKARGVSPVAAWEDWTPSLTNLSGGTLDYAKYIQLGKTVHFRFKYTLAGAGVAGGVTISLPVAPAATVGGYMGQSELHDYNGSIYLGGIYQTVAANGVNVNAFRADGTYLLANELSKTIPFTWAADDYIEIRGTYEAA